MMEENAISLKGVSKSYVIGKQKDGSLRGTLAGLFQKKQTKEETFMALNNVSFDVKKGEVVGIIGKNGAGKSTLLKVLSQITKPSAGIIELNGRVASLLEVGTGFHPELTGRENVYLNGTILGMTRKEVAAKFNEIVAFSGVEKFIDTPVKHYSSGMYVRLAFAVAAHLEPEILIIDEVLAVGDAEFQKKCLGKMKDVAGEGRTVLFVSHQLGAVRQLCTKGVLLEQGVVKQIGNIDDVISAYQNSGQSVKNYRFDGNGKSIYVANAKLMSQKVGYNSDEEINFEFTVGGDMNTCNDARMLVRLQDAENEILGSSEVKISEDKKRIFFSISSNTLIKGNYSLNLIIYQPAVQQFHVVDECCHFEVLGNNETFSHLETFNIGKVYLKDNWKYEDN